MRFTFVFVISLIGTASSGLAQLPHIGTWAIDYAKSDRGEVVWDFADLGSGLWEFRAGGRRIYHFRLDGIECPSCTVFGPWERIGPETYLTNFVAPSGLRNVLRIADDGDTLAYISKRRAADGAFEERVATFERWSGGPGLARMWRMEAERSLSHRYIELSHGVDEWFVFKWTRESRIAGEDALCVLLLDGADHPCFGVLLAPESTIAMKLIDGRTLEAVVKTGGSTAAESIYTVSRDGRSMTLTQPSTHGGSIKTSYRRR